MQRLKTALGASARGGHRPPGRSLGVGCLLFLAGAVFARSRTLNANLVDLLPESFQSVQDVRRLRERFGGIGYVVVVGTGADETALKRFADDISPKLEHLPGIRFVERRRPTEFFEQRALYFTDLEDLRTIEERVDERLAFERDKQGSFHCHGRFDKACA
jgi:hypothetical protein